MQVYQKDIEQVISDVKTDDINGLSLQEVEKRRAEFGANVLPDTAYKSTIAVFIDQFKNPLIYLLLIAATIIFFVGDNKLDAFIISVVLFFNAILGTIQEYRTQNIIESLKRLIKTNSVVIREGKKYIVTDTELVVGDIVLLKEGQRVPADARIIESHNMQVDESVLTGESEPSRKTTEVFDTDIPIGDRTNMVYKGTYVLAGSAKVVVVAVGTETEIGTIHRTVEEIQTDIPLRKELDRLSYIILLFIVSVCSFLFIIGVFTGKPIKELLVMLTALFICVVPEGLPVALTLVLVTGAYRMARKNVLVKNLQAVEALGRASVIIIDKTGTLTRNEMMVSRVYADGCTWQVKGVGYHVQGGVDLADCDREHEESHREQLSLLGVVTSLLNNTEIVYLPKLDLFSIKGDPTEAALYVLSQKLGVQREVLDKEYEKIYEIPFDSMLRYHAGFYKKIDSDDNKIMVVLAGAPEVLMKKAVQTPENFSRALSQFLNDGLRTVAIAVKYIDQSMVSAENDSYDQQATLFRSLTEDIELVGVCGIEDAIRLEVKDIIAQARRAGLHIIMATGDHEKTALRVAEQVGICLQDDMHVSGVEIDSLSDEQLINQLGKTTVYSRVSPEQKMRIVQLFHKRGDIVAMTGDGINDAPSLVVADLGIAMGNIGTEVAKQAADLVLLDDSFSNIISAIEQGRHIFYSLQRVILYFFATNMGEILIVLFALIASLVGSHDIPLPITAAQILWLNLVTDGFLDIALSMEPKEKGLLHKKWLKKERRLIDGPLLLKMLFMSIPMGIGALYVFLTYYQVDLVKARTVTLLTLALFQWFNAWNCRSGMQSVFQLGVFSNRWLVAATLFVLLLQVLIVYVPAMQYIFQTVSLSGYEWLLAFAISSSIFVAEEIRKLFVRRLS